MLETADLITSGGPTDRVLAARLSRDGANCVLARRPRFTLTVVEGVSTPTAARERNPSPPNGRAAVSVSKAPKILAGQQLQTRHLRGLDGTTVSIPDNGPFTHLQFRRFAGCPICNLHLRSFIARADDIGAAGITETVVFHSSEEDLRAYQPELPFAVIADPTRRLYQQFGVEAAPRSLLNPAVWPTVARAVAAAIWRVLRGRAAMPPVAPKGGNLGLPADFLINRAGEVVAVKYGRHASDQWTVDEVLEVACRR